MRRLIDVPCVTPPRPSTVEGLLEAFQESDSIALGMGHEPDMKTKVIARLKQLSAAFDKCTWTIVPVMQKQGVGNYVEYFLMGRGSQYHTQWEQSHWIGPAPMVLAAEARVRDCGMKTSNDALGERLAAGEDVPLCDICRLVKERFLTACPKRGRKGKEASALDDLFGGGASQGDEEVEHEASSVSEGGDSDEDQPFASLTSARSSELLASSQEQEQEGGRSAKPKLRPARQGMAPQAWSGLLHMASPNRIVLVGPVTFQAGLLMALIRYNDSRFGLQSCPLVGFCVPVPPSASAIAWSAKHIKWWQAAHLCLHTIDAALRGYAMGRHKQITSAEGAVSHPLRLSLAQRVLQREGSNSGLATTVATVQDEASALASSQGQATNLISKFIMVSGNYGSSRTLFQKPGDEAPEPDSDDDDGKSPSTDMSKSNLCKRNTRYFHKYKCKVQLSSEASGHGLFATEAVPVGTQMPVKGPWFKSLSDAEAFLARLPEDTAQMLATRLVRVDISGGDATPSHCYKVITCPVGFVNHFTQLSNQPNCELAWQAGAPLGEHNLQLKSTKAIKAGKQWLLNYGPLHACGAKVARKRFRKSGSGAPAAKTRKRA